MYALTFDIHLREPVLVGQGQHGEPNSTIAQSFIPGSVIRGALIARYQKAPAQALDAKAPEVRNLFFNGVVRYLHAYLAAPASVQSDSPTQRLLPTPRSWYVRKSKAEWDEVTLFDRALGSLPDDEPCKGWSPSFCWMAGGADVDTGTPYHHVQVHNFSLDRDRKQERRSGVYRYEALAPQQVFKAAIVTDDASGMPHLERLRDLLTGPFWLGGSQTAGYGLVEIEKIQLEDSPWQEYFPASPPTGRVVLTCLSDVIVRDATGQTTGDLGQAVGATPLESFYSLRRVGGFNRKWGLPLPEEWAIEAGSVFVFAAEHRAALQNLITPGIGERRVDGFGRIALDWQRHPTVNRNPLGTLILHPAAPATLSADSQKLLAGMGQRHLQTAIDRYLIQEINSQAREFRGLPSATQLSRARIAARQAWHKRDLGPLRDFFKQMTSLTKPQWEGARLSAGSLTAWINERMDKADTFELPNPTRGTLAGQQFPLTKEMRHQTVARLIEGVLRRAVRHAKEQADHPPKNKAVEEEA